MDTGIGRFFAPTRALIAVVIWLIAAGVGGYCVYRVIEDRVISIGGFVLAGALVLGGVGALSTAFPQGCRACKRAFESTGAAFASHLYPNLGQSFAQPDPNALVQWAGAPPADGNGNLARLNLDYCPTCRRIASATITAEQWTGQYHEVKQKLGPFVLRDHAVQATLQMIEHRGKQMPST